MDLAALIFVPFLLALIYCWPGINKIPTRRFLPTGILFVVFMAFLSYTPTIQEAIATRTPLVGTIEGFPLSFHLDGLSLIFALFITGLGAMITLYAGSFFAEDNDHRRFIQGTSAFVGVMLALVLADHVTLLFALWMMASVISFLFMRQNGKRAWVAFAIASLGGIALLMGSLALAQAGAQVRGFEEPVYAISQLSASNLSKRESYPTYVVLLFIAALTAGLQCPLQFSPRSSTLALTSASSIAGLSTLYLLARLYPAVHDNPLWWTVVTGVGLLIMLIGAVWSLRQTDLKAILIYRSMSAFGACIALLGLPEFLGVKVALIGIVVHSLSQTALFLNLDNPHKQSRLITIALALLPMAIFHLMMIGAFYQLTLAWSGIALAVVVLSTAFLVLTAIRIIRDALVGAQHAAPSFRDALSQTDPVGARYTAPSPWIPSILLAVASLLFIPIFDPLFGPLLYPAITAPRLVIDTTTPLILGIIAIIGGLMLYATRDTWERFIQTKPMTQIDNVHEH